MSGRKNPFIATYTLERSYDLPIVPRYISGCFQTMRFSPKPFLRSILAGRPFSFSASGCQCIVIHLAVRSVGPVGDDFLRCSSYLNRYTPKSLTYHIPWKEQTSEKERLVFQNIIFEGLWIFQGSNDATWFSGQNTFQETKMISEVPNMQRRFQVNHSLNVGGRGNPSSLSPTSMGSQHVFHGPRSWRRLPRRWATFRLRYQWFGVNATKKLIWEKL